jgi:predicted MPP superfamily phosphohydrolase
MKPHPFYNLYRRYKAFENYLQQLPITLLRGDRQTARSFIGNFEVIKHELSFPNLPKAWDGLTITHLSDLHLGRWFTPKHHLPPVIDACRQLKSDIICVTGDWIDFHNKVLTESMPYLRQLRAPLGLLTCLGNHDYFDNRWAFIRQLRSWLGSDLLINQTANRLQGGEKIVFLGLDFAGHGKRLQRHFTAAQLGRNDHSAFTIALAHHPNSFKFLKNANVALTLSGHTHGGQISLTRPPAKMIGPVMFHYPYIRGFYEDNGSKLYVNSGLGQSIPIRINCPAEVVQFTLKRGN